MSGFCQIWIPNFELMAKSLYEAIKVTDSESINWDAQLEQSFNQIKWALMEAPVLSMHNLQKPFLLFMAQKQPWGIDPKSRAEMSRACSLFFQRN